MEPLDGALVVVAADHLAVRHLLTQAVGGLVGVDGKVHGRGVTLLLGLTFLLLGRLGLLLSGLREGQLLHRLVHQGAIGRGVTRVTALAVALTSRAAGGGALGGRGLRDAGAPLGRDLLCLDGLLEAQRVGVHLAGSVLHQLRHLCHHVDLLIAQLLADDERTLQLDLEALALCCILLAFVLLKYFIHLLQYLWKIKEKLKRLVVFLHNSFECQEWCVIVAN